MRHIFDQYKHSENRLTHALAVCLSEDRALLREFLRWLNVTPPISAHKLHVDEQTLPGDPPVDEDTAERRGLPDLIVHDGERWCLLVESKVESPLRVGQLMRHSKTLARREFAPECLALTKAGVKAPEGVIHRSWCDLYEWLAGAHGEGVWSDRLRGYLRVAEERMIEAGSLTEGTLTMFDGFKFSEDEPYTAGEGRRLLKLALLDLRKSKALSALGMDRAGSGRPAITGRAHSPVWDFIPLRDRPGRGAFTKFPHLTLAASSDGLEVAVTIPDGVSTEVRHRIGQLGVDGLRTLNARIMRNARGLLASGATVNAYAVQRHYRSQRSFPSTDGRIEFRLEATQPGGRGRVKHQPQWLEAFASLLAGKRSNIQFGYVVHIPWHTKGVDSRGVLRTIENGWVSLKPLLDVCRNKQL